MSGEKKSAIRIEMRDFSSASDEKSAEINKAKQDLLSKRQRALSNFWRALKYFEFAEAKTFFCIYFIYDNGIKKIKSIREVTRPNAS